MPIEFVDCEQNSEEWYLARMGIPTASKFATIIAKGRGGGESKTREEYMLKLAGEILTGEPCDSYNNRHMERGKELEPQARDLYAFLRDVEPELVGFVRNGEIGCSPDALIGDDGGVEVKTALPHIQIKRLLANVCPPEYRAQVQGNIWVTERAWWDVVSYWPGLPLLVVREYRDEEYIEALRRATAEFIFELRKIVAQIRQLQGNNGNG